ncbi:MAG: polysaccharide biosynthesis protein [Rhodobacteraceae bacterium]|nr:polysaccharide biosynthesis protein [Paracoccaceae bacterium]
MQQWLLDLPRQYKRLVMMAFDAVSLPICLWLAYVLRLSEWFPTFFLENHWPLFPFASLAGVVVFSYNRIYRTVLRYIGSQALFQILKSVLLLSAIIAAAGFFFSIPSVPRSVPVIFGLVALVYVGGTRFLYRHYYHWVVGRMAEQEPIIIYGAGSAGVQLARAVSDSQQYRVVAFVDEDPHLQGDVVNNRRVYPPQELKTLTAKYGVRQVLLAIPSATRQERLTAYEQVAAIGAKVLTVPSMSDIVSGQASIESLREVDIEDLLGRDPVPPQKDLLDKSIRDKVVMVTGAGGSIGSELCRQVLVNGAKKLVMFDSSEFNLYKIEQELTRWLVDNDQGIELVPVLGSVGDLDGLERVIADQKVQTIYHAAAYKHVPMVEHNVFAGVTNNVFGTWNVCECASRNGVERFILVSTDKAVRPTNVMGATKRFAELITQELAARGSKTVFSMVRFGNVLGSSGSVIPLFRKQIAAGGPVTVTHPEITRYFMTISEAALLVIQAGSMAEGGDVFVLDMGSEVRIADMARQMIQLSGYTVKDHDYPQGDIAIKFVGLRPAEKIYEELLIGDDVAETQHPRIMRAVEDKLSTEELTRCLEGLQSAKLKNDEASARKILGDMTIGKSL